jgi:hypothetical protein
MLESREHGRRRGRVGGVAARAGGCSGNSDWLWLVRERREESECRGLEAPKARAGQRSGWVVVLLRRVCAVCLTCPSHAVCGRRRPCPLPCTPPVAAAIRHPANYTTRVDDAIAISYTKISPPSYTGKLIEMLPVEDIEKYVENINTEKQEEAASRKRTPGTGTAAILTRPAPTEGSGSGA